MTTLPQAKLDALLDRFTMVEAELQRQLPPEQFVKLSREFAELSPVIEKVKSYRSVASEIDDLNALIADPSTESGMRDLASSEKPELEEKRAAARLGGGQKRIDAQHAKGKLSARERIEVFPEPANPVTRWWLSRWMYSGYFPRLQYYELEPMRPVR